MWNGQTLAESEKIQTVEGNVYFPEETVNRSFLKPSSTSSNCPWKGQARYYTVLVDGQENPDAAWLITPIRSRLQEDRKASCRVLGVAWRL